MKEKHLAIILIILIGCLISVILGIDSFKGKNSELEEVIEPQEATDTEYHIIDLNNTANVEIIDDRKYNISAKITMDHEYSTHKFSDMKIYTEDETCYIEFKITNLNYNKNSHVVHIYFYDDEYNNLDVISYLLPTLTINESMTEKIKLYSDVSNAYDYEVSDWFEE